MTRLFPHASNSEVIAAVSNKPCRCPPSDTERLIPVHVSITSFSDVAVLTDVLFSEAQTFSSPSIRRWGGNRVNQRHEGIETRKEKSEGSPVLVKHYVTALTRKWKAQHQSGAGPRSKPAPHSPIWFCLTSALLFPLCFFLGLSVVFLLFWERAFCFFPRQKFLHVTEATTW